MDEFYNQFKENLENRPEPEYQAADWEKLAQKLDDKKPVVVPFWKRWGPAAAAAALLLLLSNAGLFYMLWQTNDDMVTISKKIEQSTVDTILIKETIVYRDTLYIVNESENSLPNFGAAAQYRFAQKTAPIMADMPLWNRRFSSDGFLKEKGIQASLLNDPIAWESRDGLLSNGNPNDGLLDDDAVENLWGVLNPFVHTFDLFPVNFPDPKMPEPDYTAKKKTSIPTSVYFTPTSFSVGGGAQVNYVTSSLPVSGLNYGLGAQVEVRLPRGLGLEGGIGFNLMQLRPDANADLSIYPSVAPSNPNDEFKYLTINWMQLQYNLGMNYAFSVSEDWQVKLGGGVMARQFLNQDYIFEFIDTAGAEYYLQQENYATGFGMNSYYIKAGTIWQWNKQWSLHTGLYYQQDFKDAHPQLLDLQEVGLRISVLYDFLKS